MYSTGFFLAVFGCLVRLWLKREGCFHETLGDFYQITWVVAGLILVSNGSLLLFNQ